MKLISNEKIEEFQKNNTVLLSNIDECAAAKLALDFAENELQNLAVEFAEWIDINGIRNNEHKWKYKFDNYVKKFTSKEMFEKFIEIRNKA